MRALRLVVLPVALVGAIVIAGCGESDEDQVRTQVDTIYDTFAEGDGEAACRLVTEEAKTQSQEDQGVTCEEGVADQARDLTPDQKRRLSNLEISEVKIDGDNATVTVKSDEDQQVIKLKKDGDEWKLASLIPD